MLNFTNINW